MCPLATANTDSVCASRSRSRLVSRTAHGSTVKAGWEIMGSGAGPSWGQMYLPGQSTGPCGACGQRRQKTGGACPGSGLPPGRRSRSCRGGRWASLGWRRAGPGPTQVVVVAQHLHGQAVVRGLPTIEGPGCPIADLMAALLRQPAQVSGPAALAGVDPRRRRHDRAAVAGLEAQLAIWAAQDLVVTVMEPSMVGCAER